MLNRSVEFGSRLRRFASKGILAAVLSMGLSSAAFAETLKGALSSAYTNNPTLNAQRAATRASDEKLPQAKAVSAT